MTLAFSPPSGYIGWFPEDERRLYESSAPLRFLNKSRHPLPPFQRHF
jgi:hypothetical protein